MSDFEPTGEQHGGGHAPTEIRLRGILSFAIALIVVIVFVQAGLSFLMGGFSRDERSHITSRSARMRDETGQFPAPRLQGNPGTDMARFRREEQARLDEYGWVDRRGGVARIPVARAMEILAARGLPTRQPAQAKAAKEAP